MSRVLVRNIGQLLSFAGPNRPRRFRELNSVGLLSSHAILIENGRISAIAPENDIDSSGAEELDAQGFVVVPGFVDPHTHLAHAGGMHGSFADRCNAVDSISESDLLRRMGETLELMAQAGTTSAEAKTGYASTVASEAKCLRALTAVGPAVRVTAMAPLVMREPLRFPSSGVHFVDALCDPEGYTPEQLKPYLESSPHRVKLHTGVTADATGVDLALSVNAISIDHLLYTSQRDIDVIAATDTIAVMLPIMPYYTGANRYAPARALIDAGAAVALGTDYNPGDSPSFSMPFAVHLACREMRLSVEEALNLATINAAYAIDEGANVGSLEVGKFADLLILATDDYRDIPASMGANLVRRIHRGRMEAYGHR